MKLGKLFVFLFVLSSVSCASYMKRRSCNKTNWFDHGKKVALKGQRLDEDAYLTECKKVESEIQHAQLDLGFKAGMAEYCKPETVFQTGKAGNFFNESMCDGGGLRGLKLQHQKGVVAFCQPVSAYDFGLTGQVYNKICPKKYEKLFLVKYKKGRIEYLHGAIDRKESENEDLQQRIRSKEREQRDLNRDLDRLAMSGKDLRWDKIKDTTTGTTSERFAYAESERVRSERESLRNQIDSIHSTISRYERSIYSNKQTIRDFKKEIRELGGK